jgi:hypothetical protein
LSNDIFLLNEWLKEVLPPKPNSLSYPSGVSIPALFPSLSISLYSVMHNQESILILIKESGDDWNPFHLIRGMPRTPIRSGTTTVSAEHLARLIQQANPDSLEVGLLTGANHILVYFTQHETVYLVDFYNEWDYDVTLLLSFFGLVYQHQILK